MTLLQSWHPRCFRSSRPGQQAQKNRRWYLHQPLPTQLGCYLSLRYCCASPLCSLLMLERKGSSILSNSSLVLPIL
jgi:hypothetical protein